MQGRSAVEGTSLRRTGTQRRVAKHPIVLLLAINVLGLGVVGGVVMRLLEERDLSRARMEALEKAAASAGEAVLSARSFVEDRTARQEAALDAELRRFTQQWRGREDDALTRGIGEVSGLAATEKQERTKADDSIGARISTLEERLQRVQRLADQQDVFARLENESAPGVLLVHSAFDYHVKGSPKNSLETGTGWGTGFLVSADGVLVTNKHVLKPWLFDPDMASLIADGDVELVGPARIHVWRSGDRCVREDGSPALENAWSFTGPRRLRVLAFAADHMRAAEHDDAGRLSEPPLHELDNNDLGVLQLDGGPFPHLVLAPAGRTHKLDRVMAIGYPRGCRGLERGIVQSSPSLGTVRKAEDTIHVTASIIPGNSGGPLINERGEVAGVVTRIYSETLGICIRAEVVNDLIEHTLHGSMAQRTAMSLVTVSQSFYR